MKSYSEREMRDLKTVFGEDLVFNEAGEPIEKGIGSPSQLTPHPTSKPSTAVKPEQIEFLRKMVAACNSPLLQKEFEAFLRWREQDALNRAAVVEISVDAIVNNAMAQPQPLDQRKVDGYRQKIRAGAIAPPIQVSQLSEGLFRIQDGWHRLAAARAEHRQFVRCEIVPAPEQTTERR